MNFVAMLISLRNSDEFEKSNIKEKKNNHYYYYYNIIGID